MGEEHLGAPFYVEYDYCITWWQGLELFAEVTAGEGD